MSVESGWAAKLEDDIDSSNQGDLKDQKQAFDEVLWNLLGHFNGSPTATTLKANFQKYEMALNSNKLSHAKMYLKRIYMSFIKIQNAHHEAGHAVVGFKQRIVLGLKIEQVTVLEETATKLLGKPGAGCVQFSMSEIDTEAKAIAKLAIHYAGAKNELGLLLERPNGAKEFLLGGIVRDYDKDDAKQLLDHWDGEDPVKRQTLHHSAEQIAASTLHFQAVQQLAFKLFNAGSLTGEKVTEILAPFEKAGNL